MYAYEDEVRPMIAEDPFEQKAREALAVESPDLAKAVYDIAQKQLDVVAARQTRTDAKATSMLGAVGLCLTVVTTTATILTRDKKAFADPWSYPTFLLACLFILLTTIAAIASGVQALRALSVKRLPTLTFQDIFDDAALLEADHQSDAKAAAGHYQRMITARLGSILARTMVLQKDQAKLVRDAQLYFFVFIACLVPSGFFLAVS